MTLPFCRAGNPFYDKHCSKCSQRVLADETIPVDRACDKEFVIPENFPCPGFEAGNPTKVNQPWPLLFISMTSECPKRMTGSGSFSVRLLRPSSTLRTMVCPFLHHLIMIYLMMIPRWFSYIGWSTMILTMVGRSFLPTSHGLHTLQTQLEWKISMVSWLPTWNLSKI